MQARVQSGVMNIEAIILVFTYLVLVNGAAYALFELDKRAARSKTWHVSEQRLLFVALIGGALGAKLAQNHLRHKTSKEPFRTQLQVTVYFQAIVIPVIFVTCVQFTPVLDVVFQ